MVIYYVTTTCIVSEKPQDYHDRIKILQEFHEKGVLGHNSIQFTNYAKMWVRGFFHIIENINIIKMIFPSKTRC